MADEATAFAGARWSADRAELRSRLEQDFASAFIRIRGAHNPDPGEPCAWCRLMAQQAAEAVTTTSMVEVITDWRLMHPEGVEDET